MARKKKELTEIEALDDFLQREGYHEIYEELTDKESEYFELFEPLKFFQVFSQTFEHIEQHKSKPLSVSRQLQKDLALLIGESTLTDEQRYFFYEKLLWWFENCRDDKQLDVCCREIEKLQKSLDVKWAETETPEREDVFARDLKHIENLPNEKDRIAYLIKRRTEEEQNQSGWDLPGTITLAEIYRLEIKKRKELMELEESQAITRTDLKKHKDLTLDRATLALNYLLTRAKANCHNTEKAKFIAFLTGYSEKQIAQKLSTLHKKEDDNYPAYEKDMKVISQYFAKLGLHEISSQIEKDLNI